MKTPALKPKSIDAKMLRWRLINSFAAGLLFFGTATVVFMSIRGGQDADGVPSVLRSNFLNEEKIGRAIYSEKHRVPEVESPVGKKPRVNGDIGIDTPVDEASYQVLIESGDQKLALKMEDIRKLPRTQTAYDFKCVEGWDEIMQFAGVKFADFMKAYKLGLRPDGSPYRYVGMETPDGEYYVSVDMESMLGEQTLLAYEMNGADLLPENGAPLRLSIPSKYGIKNLKRIGKIFFSDMRPPDYWAERGYDWFSGL